VGRRDIRIAALPPEVPDRVIEDALTKYGKVLDIKEKSSTTSERYKSPMESDSRKQNWNTIYRGVF
jgi:hypothetical protein